METSFAVQIINDRFKIFDVKSDASFEKILPKILKEYSGQLSHEENNLNNYRVLIAYQLANDDIMASMAAIDNASLPTKDLVSIRDFRLENGAFLIFVKTPVSSTKLELVVQRQRLALLDRQDEFLLGRIDEEQGIFPAIDVTKFLRRENENKISRQQAIIFGDDSKWFIKLHDEARTSVFINNEQLERGRTYEIKDDVAINLGSDPENPILRILTRLLAE